MKTAEKILREKVPTITFGKLIGTPIEQVISAMEEYANQSVGQLEPQPVFAYGDLVAVSNIKDFPLSDATLGTYRMKIGDEYFINGVSCGYDYCILVKQK